MVRHKRIHSRERPFQCNICDKAFTRSSSLVEHKRIHSGERPFQCNVSSGLIKHTRIPNVETSFQCKAFTLPSGLVQHIRTPTAGSLLHCDKTSSDLNQCKKTHQRPSIQNIEPLLSEPRQWIVIEGQCVPIKQEVGQNASSILEKQDHLVVRGQHFPIKQDLDDKNASSMKGKYVARGQYLSIKQELEEGNDTILLEKNRKALEEDSASL